MEVKTTKVKLSAIKTNPDNPRLIKNEQFKRLVKSLREFPDMLELREIVVDENMVVLGGNMRLKALQEIGEKEVLCKIVTGLTPEQKREFIVKDNAAFGDWDFETLANEWGDLPLAEWGINLPDDFLNQPIGEQDAEPQIDRAAELNKKWQVQAGDLWNIGEHRLLCGDSTKIEDVENAMDKKTASFVFSDAPYGISIVNTKGKVSTGLPVGPALRSGKVGGNKAFGKVDTIDRGMKQKPIIPANTYAPVIGDDNGDTARKAFLLLFGLFPKAVHVWWGANHYSDVFPPASCWIVWDKNNGESFFADAELAFCTDKTAVRIFKHQWNGLIKESERGEKRCHPTQKPAALAVWCMESYGEQDDIVFDPFMGSGCSMVAAQNLSRKCYGIEISPDYCAVILERMQTAFPDIKIEKAPTVTLHTKENK